MADSLRAKFRVNTVTHYENARNVDMTPVTNNRGENSSFFSSTPAGTLSMYITNPDTLDFFKPGDYVYLDFSKAPQE